MLRLPTLGRAVVAALTMLLLVGSVGLAATTVDDVSQGLTCQCGCGLTVANCNHPECSFSVPMRGEIQRMIDEGKDRPAIIAFYRTKYGEKILSAPTTEGFNLLAWVMPFFAIVTGGGLIVMVLGKWKHQSPTPAPVDAQPSVIDPKLRERLDAEVKGEL
ncbi:MAG TPA: cytochrome c-type biogenesis protein CcmH [Candidatus Binataceae bacterium]|nr:cytochrome c-type biogenesis protein CcmH [Candidatus Binataceae bacterium]